MAEAESVNDANALIGAPGMTVAGHRNAGAVINYEYDPGETDDYNGETVLTQNSLGVPGHASTGARFGAAVAVSSGDDNYIGAIGVPGATVAGQPDAGEVIVTNFYYGKFSVISRATRHVPGVAEAGDEFGESLGDFTVYRTDVRNYPAKLEVGIPGEDLEGTSNAGQVEQFTVANSTVAPSSAALIARPHPKKNNQYGASF